MAQIIHVSDREAIVFKNRIRDRTVNGRELRKTLYILGVLVGAKVLSSLFSEEITVWTPLGIEYKGVSYRSNLTAVIVTNKDDYEALGSGLATVFPVSYRGYLDITRVHGKSGFSSKIRGMTLPKVKARVDLLVIAKSVLASGCSLITLTREALQKYTPSALVIVALFYSKKGLQELIQEFPNAFVVIVGDADTLDENGMLVPGVGMIDERLSI